MRIELTAFFPLIHYLNIKRLLIVPTLLLNAHLFSQSLVYESNDLKIIRLTEKVYQHVTYLNTDQYGKVACNGMLVIDEGESAVFDTPSYNEVSRELIAWLQDSMRTTIKMVVVNHHHIDCLGGLDAFAENGTPSTSSVIARHWTIKKGNNPTSDFFETEQIIQIGKSQITNRYFGPAHSQGAIVSYVEGENVLFGGCSVKSLNAGKGNLEDANVQEWPKTIQKVKNSFPDIKIVIPGHGKQGGTELLSYTITMFEKE